MEYQCHFRGIEIDPVSYDKAVDTLNAARARLGATVPDQAAAD